MRLILDANIVLSAILGRTDPIGTMFDSGADLLIPEAQAFEVIDVLKRKLGFDDDRAQQALDQVLRHIRLIETTALLPAETVARGRLDGRGQPDWPVLAAAIELGADIWSHDRDFFGVGVAVWKTGNVIAAAGAA